MKGLNARPCGEHVTCISPSNPQNNSVTGTQLGSDKDPQETTQRCIVAQSCLTLCDPMDCSPTGTSVHGDSPGKNTRVSCHVLLQGISPTQGSNSGLLFGRRILYHLSHQRSPWILQWVADPFLQGIFPTQESNQGLLPCRQILATQPVSGGFSDVEQAIWFQSMYIRVPNGSADFLR